MRIDKCPHCNKAGLTYTDTDGKYADGLTGEEHHAMMLAGKTPSREDMGLKYCQRCKLWVKPAHDEWSRVTGTISTGRPIR